MKIYVDGELPKCCRECGFCCKDDLGCWCQGLGDGGVYILDEILKEKRLGSCPLETTQSLKQQVREEVVEDIKEKIKNIKENIWFHHGEYGLINDVDYGQIYGLNKLLRILDKVKGENNVKD